MDQVKVFKGCLPQISFGPFFNTLYHMWLMDTSITFQAIIFTRRSQSVETWCSYIACRRGFLRARNILYLNSYILCYFFNAIVTNRHHNSFFGGSNFFIRISCCASLLKSSLPTQVLGKMWPVAGNGPSNFAFSIVFRRYQLSLTVFQKFDTKISYWNQVKCVLIIPIHFFRLTAFVLQLCFLRS